MATTEAALVALLVQGGIANPVFNLVGTRVYPLVLPQPPTYPAIRYQRIDTQRGPWRMLASGRSRYAKPRFQIDCYALTPASAQALGNAVAAVLDGFASIIPVAGIVIGSTAAEDEGANIEIGAGPGGSAVFRWRRDFLVGHYE